MTRPRGVLRSRLGETRFVASVCLALALAASSFLVTACDGEERALLAPPAAAVQSLLELRAAHSTDATAYARYIESTEVAGVLAADAEDKKGKDSVPEWETPSLEESSDTTAAVLVVWKPSDAFTDWPESTTFLMKKAGDRWVLIDASESRSNEATGPAGNAGGSSNASPTPESP